ncbi:MAG: hypothetical protein ACI86X_001641 [Moritella sp.]|jgi:hypothetical protein
MHIHLNGFDFEFSQQIISSFINSKDYQDLSSDIAGIHLADIYQQMIYSGIDKTELIKAMLNYHISTLHEEGISVDEIKKTAYQDVNVSFLIDVKSDRFARFVNFKDKIAEDTVTINFRNFNEPLKLTYSELMQLEESYRDYTNEQLLLIFLETFRTVMDAHGMSHRRPHYATLTSTGLLLFVDQINILDAIQFKEIEFELNTDRLLLNLPAGLDTALFELELNAND